jgi:hypothetical protein
MEDEWIDIILQVERVVWDSSTQVQNVDDRKSTWYRMDGSEYVQ